MRREAVVEGWRLRIGSIVVGIAVAMLAGAARAEEGSGRERTGPEWVVKLADADAGVRAEALTKVRMMGLDAVPDLIAALDSDISLTRFWAARLLGEIRATEAVPALVERTQSELAAYALSAAARALAEIGGAEATTALRRLLLERPEIAAAPLAVLADHESIPGIVRALAAAKDLRERVALATALCRMGCRAGLETLAQTASAQGTVANREALATLREVLEDPLPADAGQPTQSVANWWNSHRETVRLKNELDRPTPPIETAIEKLLDDLWSDDAATRDEAQRVLTKLDNLAIPHLVREIGGPNSERACEALAAMGLSAKIALIAALGSPDDVVRREVVSLLTELKARDAEPALAEIVKTPGTDPKVVDLSYRALLTFGYADLTSLLGAGSASPDPAARAAAARALGRKGDDEAGAVLEDMARFPHGATGAERAAVGAALVRCGKASGIPILIEALSDPDRSVRAEAIESLRIAAGRYFGFDPDAEEARRVEAIERWRDFHEREKESLAVDVQALKNLDQFASPMRRLRQDLGEALRKLGDSDLPKREAGEVLIGNRNRLWAPAFLLEALPRLEGQARVSATSILAGLMDRRAIPALVGLLADPSPVVRRIAAGGLGNLTSRLHEDEGRVLASALRQAFAAEREVHARIALAHALGKHGDATGIPVLIELMKAERSGDYPLAAWVRDEAFLALRDLAIDATGGKDFGFEANASATARAAAVDAWEKWWAEKGSEFKPRNRFLKPKSANE
jgi:HEAT repeat protein